MGQGWCYSLIGVTAQTVHAGWCLNICQDLSRRVWQKMGPSNHGLPQLSSSSLSTAFCLYNRSVIVMPTLSLQIWWWIFKRSRWNCAISSRLYRAVPWTWIVKLKAKVVSHTLSHIARLNYGGSSLSTPGAVTICTPAERTFFFWCILLPRIHTQG